MILFKQNLKRMPRINPYFELFTLFATLGELVLGFASTVISGTVGSLKAYFIKPRNLTDPNVANSLWGIVNSSVLIGRSLAPSLAGNRSWLFCSVNGR